MTQSFLQNHYDITEIEDGYKFITDKKTEYYISFISYPLLDNLLAVKTYMFNIERVSVLKEKEGQNDSKVRHTILYILYIFFQNHNDALITICDILDGKQHARKRLFDSWFDKYNDGSLVKVDSECSIEEITTYTSILYSANNIYGEKLSQGFKELTENNFYN